MLAWIARRKQVAALERDVAALAGRLTAALERSEAEAGRADQLAGRVALLERQCAEQRERLDAVETRLSRVDDERSGTADYLDRMIVRYDGHYAEMAQLRTDLARLTHRFDLHAEDISKTTTALLDRIERTRTRV